MVPPRCEISSLTIYKERNPSIAQYLFPCCLSNHQSCPHQEALRCCIPSLLRALCPGGITTSVARKPRRGSAFILCFNQASARADLWVFSHHSAGNIDPATAEPVIVINKANKL